MLPVLFESTPIVVDEMLGYVVGRLGSTIFLTVAIPYNHIL